MLFNKSALLFFTTLALSGAVQGVAIQGPVARELENINGNVALNIRADESAAMGLNQKMVERDPRSKAKAASPAALKNVQKSSSQIAAATKELQRFRASHKKAVKKTKSKRVGAWWGRDAELSEREIVEERARKSQANADLRKTLRVVNQHLLAAAGNLRAVQRRDMGDEVDMDKRVLGPITDVLPTLTDIVPTLTDVLPPVTDVLPTLTDVIPTLTDVLPTLTDVLPTLTDVLPTLTDVIPTLTDVLPTVTDVLPTLTLPLPTDTTTSTSTTSAPTTSTTAAPVTGIAALIAAIRALVALIRALIRELVATILESFGGFGSVDPSVLREVSPGLSAVFSATSDSAKSVSPNAAAAVDPVLNSLRTVLSKYGFTF